MIVFSFGTDILLDFLSGQEGRERAAEESIKDSFFCSPVVITVRMNRWPFKRVIDPRNTTFDTAEIEHWKSLLKFDSPDSFKNTC